MIRRVLLALSLLILSFPAQARDSILDIQEVKSPGGITAWLVEDHSVPVIAVEFSFKGAGSVQDPADKQGLARLASNTMDEGAAELDSQSFQKALRDLSISLRYSVGRDHFSGSLKTLTRNKDQAMDLLKKSLTAPRFDEEPLERMRQANIARIRSSLSDPEWIAARILNDVAYAGHPYARNSGGTLSSLAAITPEDLKNFHKNYIGKNNLVVSVAGDIKAEELQTLLDDVFGALPDVNISPPADLTLQNQSSIYLYKMDVPQTIIEMVQPGIGRKDPDYPLAQIMNFALGSSGFGSRLTEEIREKRGLTYGIYSYFNTMDHIQTLSVSTSTQNENAQEMLSLIHAEWNKMAQDGITAEELADAKSYIIGSLPLSLSSTDRIARLMTSLQEDGMDAAYLDRYQEAIESATIEQINTATKKLLNAGGFVTIMTGQPEGVENAQIVQELPNVE